MDAEQQRGRGGSPADRGFSSRDGRGQQPSRERVDKNCIEGVKDHRSRVISGRLRPPEHVVEAQGQPRDGNVRSRVGDREHPANLGPAEAAVMRVGEKVFFIVPVDKAVTERRQEHRCGEQGDEGAGYPDESGEPRRPRRRSAGRRTGALDGGRGVARRRRDWCVAHHTVILPQGLDGVRTFIDPCTSREVVFSPTPRPSARRGGCRPRQRGVTMSSGKILVVDDEREVRLVIQEFLTGKGYEVRVASNGLEALAGLETFMPDVVLLDMAMPEMDGLEALKRISASYPSLPVLMVTVNADIETTSKVLQLGAADYVPKPFDLDYLDQAISIQISAGRDR